MSDLLNYLRLRRETLAKRNTATDHVDAADLAEVGVLDRFIEEVEDDGVPKNFNPAWKHGFRLTMAGRKALRRAWEAGMPQSEAARLFQISLTRAHVLHHEWKAEQAAQTTAEAETKDLENV